ncbi:MAG TPA: vitamin K epoxide reductase family protein [Candidatus Acidoferrales bacterium]|nr:vitamin K epoxide reductase family protein [Candidatus Acidoferrales bacterium]
MDNKHQSTPASIPPLAWLKWARLLLLIALAGASYLAWVSIHHGSAAGCGPESGCNAVLQSRWAYWFGLPVSVPAALVYLALLGATVLLQKNTSPDDQRGSWAAIIILSVLVAGAAFWFVSLQVFVIQSFCKYCLTAHACGFAAALICLMNIPLATDPDTPMWSTGSGKRGVPKPAMLQLILVGLCGVAVLAAGQLLVQKQRNVVKELKNPPAASAQPSGLPAEIVPASPNAHLIAPRTLSLYSNQFVIKFNELPMLGSPGAPHVLVCLLDYSCVHCRALHPILKQLTQQYSNELAVVCLPVSLSPLCNPFVPHLFSQMPTNSCVYARLALAVWRARPDLYRQFDDWMFEPVKPPTVEEAQDYATKLVGADKLKAALADPWVAKQIITDCKLHRANWLAADNSALPQIVMGNAISSGPINSPQHLLLLLRQYLNLSLSP